MNNSVLKIIDVKNYASMAARMFPASRGLLICSEVGKSLRASDESVLECLAALNEHKPNWFEQVDSISSIDVDNDSFAVVMNLVGAGRPDGAFLVWWMSREPASHKAADMHDTLMSIGACMKTELSLHQELDSMALELSERYEELNLVYHTDDHVNFFNEGHEALAALVDNCAEYLDATMSALYLPAKKIFIPSTKGIDETEARVFKQAIESGLYNDIAKSQSVEFVNNDDGAVSNSGLPYRLMAARVVVFGDQIEGVLVVANNLSGRKYSNSDKNLLSVMVRKVAKIIQSSYDSLTGMLNRYSFEAMVTGEVERTSTSDISSCILHINIDHLHRVNETLGHEAGDMVIRRIAQQLEDELRDTDSIGRVGGDEYGVMILNCTSDQGLGVAKKLTKAIATLPLEWQGTEINATVSIGVAEIDNATVSGEQVLKDAAMTCDMVNEDGGNDARAFEVHDASVREREESMWMVGTVHTALREGGFMLYAQPIVPLRSGRPHLEVLLRMKDGDRIVPPHAFLPASERYQLMVQIDEWVVENSLQTLRSYLDDSPAVAPVFGINLSGQSIGQPDFLDFSLVAIKNSGVPPELVCLEITETAAVSNVNDVQRFIAAMRDIGCVFALDDFGAGLSSFGYLKSFDVQYLKIDGALVRDIETDQVSAAMVESVNQIGHVMELQTIAEYVETPEANALLAKIGVDYVQGYLHGKPIPIEEQLRLMNQASIAAGA